MAPDSFLTRAGMRFPWRHSRSHDPAAGLGDLEAALKDDGCPVCARTTGADERWLDRFLDDGYLERNLVRSIKESGGFCAFHAFRIAEIGQSATVALIYLGLIEYCLPRFAARRPPGADLSRCSPHRTHARHVPISRKSNAASAFFLRC